MEASVLGGPLAFSALAVAALVSLCVWLAVRYDRQQQQRSVGVKDGPLEDNSVFQNLLNFRDVGTSCLHNRYGQKIREGLVFRSSRTDFVTEEEADQFLKLGIKSIIDLRTKQEYNRASGAKILSKYYSTCDGKICKVPSDPRKRYFISLMTKEYAKMVYSQVNCMVRSITPVIMLVDWLFHCNLTIKLFSHLVINRQSLAEWYVDILEHAKPQVVGIMRLLVEGSNIPVLVNCAHGKDRTGMIIALILGCLDVKDEVIARDYSLSEAGLAPVISSVVREATGKYGFKAEFTTATVGTMSDLLSELSRRYGGVPGYLSAAGFTADEQQALKNIFLEI